jgi:nucleoid-associated protein YgaU
LAAESSPARVHVVQRGDTLQSLALRFYGTRSAWEKIYQANRNGLPSKDQLKIGQQLVIP